MAKKATTKKATKRTKTATTADIVPAGSTAPEFERQEAAPESLEQITEPTIEPQATTAKGAPKDSGKEEMNEDLPVRPAPKQNIPQRNQGSRNHGRGKHDDDACHCYESPYPKGKLPPPPVLAPRELEDGEKPKAKQGKDGFDRAMEMLDEYYEGTPQRNPNVDHGGED